MYTLSVDNVYERRKGVRLQAHFFFFSVALFVDFYN